MKKKLTSIFTFITSMILMTLPAFADVIAAPEPTSQGGADIFLLLVIGTILVVLAVVVTVILLVIKKLRKKK